MQQLYNHVLFLPPFLYLIVDMQRLAYFPCPSLFPPSTGREQEAAEKVKKALESVRLKQRNAVAAVVGVTGAGKTCALHCVFGLQPPKRYTSTGVAERSFRGLLHRIANMRSFQLLSQQEIFSFLADAFSSEESHVSFTEHLKEPRPQSGSTQELPTISSSTSTSVCFPTSPHTDTAAGSSSSPLNSQMSPNTTNHENTFSTDAVVIEKSFSTSAMTDFVQMTTRSKKAFVVDLLHMIDTGGQPEFMEVMPCLIHNSNLTVIVVDLTQSLDAYPKLAFHRDGKDFRRPIGSALTNRQIIQQFIHTMQAKRCSKRGGKHFKFMVIGTHRDRLWFTSSTLAAFNRELKSMFIPAFQQELIVYRSVDEILFPVNARNPNQVDENTFDRIRHSIRGAGIGIEIEIPPAFFMFEQDVQMHADKLGRDIFSLNECVKFGVLLNMSREVVVKALDYLHNNNIFLYFQDFLPDLVFLSPQVPLNFFNELVAFSYKVKSGNLSGLPAEFIMLLHDGIITEEMLRHESFSSCFVPDLYQPRHALSLFQHIYTIALLKDEEVQSDTQSQAAPITASHEVKQNQYLMMSLLPVFSEKMVKKFIPWFCKIAPLVIRFTDDCVPNGVFSSIVSCLISTYSWRLYRTSHGSPDCLARNMIRLRDPSLPVAITLVNLTRHLEIHINTSKVQEMIFSQICSSIYKTIFTAIEKVFKVMQFEDVEVQRAFLCPCKSFRLSHAAEVGHISTTSFLTCSKTESNVGSLQKKQLYWFQDRENGQLAQSMQSQPSQPPPQPTQPQPTQPEPQPTQPQPTQPEPLQVQPFEHQQMKPLAKSQSYQPSSATDMQPHTAVPQSMIMQPAPSREMETQAIAVRSTQHQSMQSHPMPSSQGMQYQSVKPKERLPNTEDRPTLEQLIDFKTTTGSENVVKLIGTDYNLLGAFLLQDKAGTVTDAIADEHHHNAFKVNYHILKQWIQGKGRQPVQWSTLIDVFKKIELSELAKTMEASLQ